MLSITTALSRFTTSIGTTLAVIFALIAPHAIAQINDDKPTIESAIFAGGCFWCMEPPFDKIEGVLKTTSGYIGGHQKNPTYKQVTRGNTGHYEVVKIDYDPTKVSYSKLLTVFWQNIDPLNSKGQFCDIGEQYLSAIFYLSPAQKLASKKSLQNLAKRHQFDSPIATKILPASTFYPAEDYHQDYYLKNPYRYKYYRTGCGRDKRLYQLWK